MTLGNMRENGVRSLSVFCHACHNEAIVNLDNYDAALTVPSFGPRMCCQRCGKLVQVSAGSSERAAIRAKSATGSGRRRHTR